MKLDTKLSEFIEYSGDRSIIFEWNNFHHVYVSILKRAFYRNFPNENFWLKGLSHEMLDQICISDLNDLKQVGQKRLTETLNHLKLRFETLEREVKNNLHTLDIFTELVPKAFESSNTEDNVFNDPIETAQTIEELREAILNSFDTYSPIDERTREIIFGRHFAFANQPYTLEELGIRFGITRERVRQIASKYEELVLSSPRRSSELMEKILNIAESSDNEGDFAFKLHNSNLTIQEDFSIANAVFLCEIIQLNQLSELFLNVSQVWENHLSKLDELAKSSQKFRNKMGIIDLEFMANETHMPVSECRSAILRAYPRSIFKGKYALARSEKFDTTFENILYKQLLFTENLTCAELLEGVRRFSTYRNSELLGEMNDFEEIVKLLTGSPPTLTKLKTQMLEETELSTTDQWLINCFQSQSKELIHRSEFVEMAIESGKNTGTILIYVLFNPLIRNCGHSVYSLIGTDISDEEVRVYAEIIRKNLRETELSYTFDNGNIILKILPNSNALGGVIFPSKELYQLVSGFTFIPRCSCDELHSNQKIQFSVANFWMGFSSLFKHGIEKHLWGVKNSIEIVLDFESKTATLVANSIQV